MRTSLVEIINLRAIQMANELRGLDDLTERTEIFFKSGVLTDVPQLRENCAHRISVAKEELRRSLLNSNPLHLLASLALEMFARPRDDSRDIPVMIPFTQSSLELLQAFSLQYPISEYTTTPASSHDALSKLVREIPSLVFFERILGWQQESEENRAKRMIRERLMSHTESNRITAYPQQMREIIVGLYSGIDDEIQTRIGIRVGRLYEALDNIIRRIDRKTREYLRVGSGDVIELFSINIEELTQEYGSSANSIGLKKVMDNLSYDFGDLQRKSVDHFILDNPVWTKPFIRGNGKYYCFSPGTLWYFGLSICEALVDKKLYDRRKGEYLEEAISSLFRSHSSIVLSGSKWKDPSGNEGENDVTAIIGTCCVICEAKAGKLPIRAKRGDPMAIASTIGETLRHGIKQAAHFESVLKSSNGIHSFITRRGMENRVDCQGIDAYINLVVTMLPLGMLNGSISQWVNAGILTRPSNSVVCISLPHLMSVFELLKLRAEILRYFQWRVRVEQQTEYYGDELDLLSLFRQGRAEEIFQNGDIADEAKKLTKYLLK